LRPDEAEEWENARGPLAVDSSRCSTAAVLFSDYLRLNVSDSKSPANDRFLLS
jgi:transketolase